MGNVDQLDENTKRCALCGEGVDADYLCHGCNAYICDNCDDGTNSPIGVTNLAHTSLMTKCKQSFSTGKVTASLNQLGRVANATADKAVAFVMCNPSILSDGATFEAFEALALAAADKVWPRCPVCDIRGESMVPCIHGPDGAPICDDCRASGCEGCNRELRRKCQT